MNREIKIDLKRCLRAIISGWWIIMIATIAIFVMVSIYTYEVDDDQYVAATTVYSVGSDSYQETLEAINVMTTYSEIITSLKISERAAVLLGDRRIDAYDIQKMIQASYSASSTVLEIDAYSSDEDLAIKVANAVADAFIIEIGSITGGESVQLLDRASYAEIYYNGKVEQRKIRLIAVAVALALSSLFIALHEIFTSKIYDISDARLEDELYLIGVIPLYEKRQRETKE